MQWPELALTSHITSSYQKILKTADVYLDLTLAYDGLEEGVDLHISEDDTMPNSSPAITEHTEE